MSCVIWLEEWRRSSWMVLGWTFCAISSAAALCPQIVTADAAESGAVAALSHVSREPGGWGSYRASTPSAPAGGGPPGSR